MEGPHSELGVSGGHRAGSETAGNLERKLTVAAAVHPHIENLACG